MSLPFCTRGDRRTYGWAMDGVGSHDRLLPALPGFHNVQPLAEGGFGSVFRATRSSTGGTVAIKVLDQIADAASDTLERRVNREIAALVALKGHPNVVQVEEMFLTSRGPAMVMEYMDGGSVLPEGSGGVLPSAVVADVGVAVANALEAAHSAGIVHRDVKPRNVLKNSFGQIKLCDFGIAALDMPKVQQTRTASLSLHYASPEELDEAEDVGPPTDIYSLGASLYHLLNGRPPSFRALRGGGAIDDSTVLRQHDPQLDGALHELCRECLQTEPEHRPTAAQVRDRIEAAQRAGAPAPVPPEPQPETETERTIRRSELPPPNPRPPAPPSPAPEPHRPGADGLPTDYDPDWWRN